MIGRTLVLLVTWVWVLSGSSAFADSILRDTNGDGQLEILAFGDSITYGVGDGTQPGEYVATIQGRGSPGGYPLRLSALVGVPVYNAGVPGEELVGSGAIGSGIDRFPNLVVGSSVDVVIIMEGSNDSQHFVTSRTYSTTLQKAINVARSEGKQVVLATLPPQTGNHAQFAGFTYAYSESVRQLVTLNSLSLSDVEQAFLQGCPDLSTCAYLNLPEGLHPNTPGYDAITDTMAAALN